VGLRKFPFKVTLLLLLALVLLALYGERTSMIFNLLTLAVAFSVLLEGVGYTTLRSFARELKEMKKDKLAKYDLRKQILILILYIFSLIAIFAMIMKTEIISVFDYYFYLYIIAICIITLSLSFYIHRHPSFLFSKAKYGIVMRMILFLYFIILLVLISTSWSLSIVWKFQHYWTSAIVFIITGLLTLYLARDSLQTLFPRFSDMRDAPDDLTSIIKDLNKGEVRDLEVKVTEGPPYKIFSFSTEESNYLVFSDSSLRFFTKEELKAIAMHELAHIKADSRIRFYDCIRTRLYRDLLISLIWLFALPGIIIMDILFSLFFIYLNQAGLSGMNYRIELLFFIFFAGRFMTEGFLRDMFINLIGFNFDFVFMCIPPFIALSALMISVLGSPMEISEMRADFISALFHHEGLKSALLKASKGGITKSDAFSRLYFSLPGGGKWKGGKISDVRPRIRDLIVPQRNLHPPLKKRLLIAEIARKIASEGLDVVFLKPLSEKEFAPIGEKFLRAAEVFREKGRIKLDDAEGLSPEELFGLLMFMERKGIISIELNRILLAFYSQRLLAPVLACL